MSDRKKVYHYAPHRNHWGIWDSDGYYIEDHPTREEARKRVYELNGWAKPQKKVDTMDKDQFIEEVRLMRKWQKEYFKIRSPEALRYAKNMEKRVDAVLEKIDRQEEKENNPELFNP